MMRIDLKKLRTLSIFGTVMFTCIFLFASVSFGLVRYPLSYWGDPNHPACQNAWDGVYVCENNYGDTQETDSGMCIGNYGYICLADSGIYYSLTVNKSGTGSGSVTPFGTEEILEDTTVGIEAVVPPYTSFNGWTGPCYATSGSCAPYRGDSYKNAICYVRMDSDKTVTAFFSSGAPLDRVTSVDIYNNGNPSPHVAGSDVTFSAQGSGSCTPKQYRFRLSSDGGNSWSTVLDYGSWWSNWYTYGSSCPDACIYGQTVRDWTMPANTPPGNYKFEAAARTSTGVDNDATTVIDYVVQPAPLTITTSSLPNADLGVPYLATALQANGGLTPYSWSIWNGDAYWQFRNLPPGLYLDPTTGVISGTPTSTGSYDFRVQVLDSQPLTGYNTFYISVYSSVTIITASLPAGNVSSSYNQTLSASGGSNNFTWSLDSGNLPSGLYLNSSTGVISGTISGSGDASFTVRVTDQYNPSITTNKPFTIHVYPQLQITTTSLPAGAYNVSYYQSLAATGGNGNYTWSLDAGNLPTNTTLYSNGTISGTPTSSGHYSLVVRVTDNQSSPVTTTQSLSLDIYSSISITTPSISSGTSGTAYSQQLYASGGNGNPVWSVISGSLPAGLSLSSSGSLSGIPADVGQFNFMAQVTDTQNSPPASHSYSTTITNGAMQQCADNPVSVSSGANPNVCTLSTTNVISGVVDHDQELFTTKGSMQNIAISLLYKSLPAYNGSLGTGWSHSYDISLTLNADGSVILKNGNGDKRYYTKSGSTYISPTGDYSTLVKNGDNSYTISFRDGSKYNFDSVGKITSLTDRYSNAISIGYTGSDMTSITDSTGRVATIGYDQSTTPHRILTVTDPIGSVYNFSYQGNSLYRVTNPAATYGATRGYWEYQYYTDGTLKTKRDPNGYISQYSYYADKKMQTATDQNGRTRTIVYPTTSDTLRTSTLTEKDGGQWLYTYDSTTGVIKQKTDPNGKLTDFYYYANGLVKAKTEPKDGATRLTTFYKFDAYGNLEIETDPVDVSTYSPAIDPDAVTDVATLASRTPPIKAARHYSYDYDNLPGHYDRINNIADKRGATTISTSFAYSTENGGEVVTATSTPGNYTTTTSHITVTKKNSNGSISQTVDANTKTTSFTYYPNSAAGCTAPYVGLLCTVTDPAGINTAVTSYDNNGNSLIIKLKDSSGAIKLTSTQQYDALNRIIKVTKTTATFPDNVTQYGYDLAGNLTSSIDAEQHETKYEYNFNRQVKKIIDAKLNETIFIYSGSELNGIDKLVAVYDANVAKNTPFTSQPHTVYQYDHLGRLDAETDPLGKKLHYTYYDNGPLKEKYDATASTPGTLLVTYTYNNRGQITDKSFTDGTYEHYTYTAIGQLETASNQNIGYTYSYYNDGRLLSVTDTNSNVVRYDQYDGNGQRNGVTYLPGTADQRSIGYDYDNANRPAHIYSNAGMFTYSYDTLGRRDILTYPNYTRADWTFDDLGRLTSIIHYKNTYHHSTFGGNYYSYDPFAAYYYTHDQVGNRLTKTGTVNETYGYDELYRLLSVTTTKSEAFTYDAAGNRLTGPSASDTTYKSNAANQIIQGRKLTYGYDNHGNQATKTVPSATDKTWIRTWDLNNRLTKEEKVKGTEVKTVTYKYDPFGRRIEKKFVQTKSGVTETETTNYVYDKEDIVVEYFTTAGVTEKTFVTHGHGIDEPLAMERNGQYFYYHADGLGSITNITVQSFLPFPVQSYTYDAYGMAAASTDFRNSYQHTGREYDWETGTLYMRERTRDLIDGNFISKDPIAFQSGDANFYRYVGSNVQNYIDPFGLSEFTPDTPANISRFPSGGGGISINSGNLSARCGGSPSQLTAGQAFETQQLSALNATKNTKVWRPSAAQAESASFRIVVGEPKRTPTGALKGTILDSTQNGLLEIKGGSSTLDSSYQLRMQVYRSVIENNALTIQTTRPINPTFENYLLGWGVNVK